MGCWWDARLRISHMRSTLSKNSAINVPFREKKKQTQSLKISFLEWDRVYTQRMLFSSLSNKYLSPLIYLIRTRYRLPGKKKMVSSSYQNALWKKDNILWNWRAIWVLEFVVEQWLIEITWLNNVSDWYAWDRQQCRPVLPWTVICSTRKSIFFLETREMKAIFSGL